MVPHRVAMVLALGGLGASAVLVGLVRFVGYFELKDDDKALLCINHEYTDEEVMFPGVGVDQRGRVGTLDLRSSGPQQYTWAPAGSVPMPMHICAR